MISEFIPIANSATLQSPPANISIAHLSSCRNFGSNQTILNMKSSSLKSNNLSAIRVFALSVLFLISVNAYSQDTLFFKDGRALTTVILEISETTIKYKRFDQQEGPLRSVKTDEIHKIIYADNTEEVISTTPVPKTFRCCRGVQNRFKGKSY